LTPRHLALYGKLCVPFSRATLLKTTSRLLKLCLQRVVPSVDLVIPVLSDYFDQKEVELQICLQPSPHRSVHFLSGKAIRISPVSVTDPLVTHQANHTSTVIRNVFGGASNNEVGPLYLWCSNRLFISPLQGHGSAFLVFRLEFDHL
jgi:hypothetical protein